MDCVPIRLLLVEDDEADYLRTRRILTAIESQTFELDWARSFEAGLDGVRRKGHDVYLIDYRLNAGDGLDLLAEFYRTENRAPVILLTGMSDYRLAVDAMKLGAADFIVKDEMTAPLLERSIRFAIEQARAFQELRRQQEELRTSELRFRSVVQSATDAIVIADSAARVIFWNSGAESIFGYREDEVVDLPLELLMPERYRQAHRMGFERFRLTGKSRIIGRTIEVEGLRKDGGVFPLELSLASWSTGEGTFFTAIIRDVTDRKQAEEARRAKEAAEEASRAKSSFVAKISHEVRTPLTAIIGFTNLLLRNGRESVDDRAREFLDRILANGKDLLQLINGMLDLSKIEAGNLDVETSPVALEDMIRDVVRQLDAPHRNRDVEVSLNFPDHLSPIWTDAAKLKQVLVNLIENALKFTAQGTVSVSVGTGQFDAAPARIDISDTGIGIPAEQIERIFEPFYQVNAGPKSSCVGTGLGLSICRSLCDLLGYTLEVQSRLGSGTTFSILLEAEEQQMPLSA